MTKVAIDAVYYSGALSTVDLPVDWTDIKDWYIKWDTFHYTTGEEWAEVELNSDFSDAIDTKRPKSVTVYAVLEDDEIDWGTELGEK